MTLRFGFISLYTCIISYEAFRRHAVLYTLTPAFYNESRCADQQVIYMMSKLAYSSVERLLTRQFRGRVVKLSCSGFKFQLSACWAKSKPTSRNSPSSSRRKLPNNRGSGMEDVEGLVECIGQYSRDMSIVGANLW